MNVHLLVDKANHASKALGHMHAANDNGVSCKETQREGREGTKHEMKGPALFATSTTFILPTATEN